MPLISESYGFLFLMAPRTGCTAVGHALETIGATWIPPEHILDERGNIVVDRKHATLADLIGHGILSPADADRLFTFCGVRNPFDSLVTWYFTLKHRYRKLLDDPDAFVHRIPGYVDQIRYAEEHPFSDWVIHEYRRKASWKRPWARLTHGLPRPRHMYGGYLTGARFVMRFERLEEDLATVLSRVGAPPAEIRRVNDTPQREPDYRPYYTPEARRVVEYVFRPDLKRFGYRF